MSYIVYNNLKRERESMKNLLYLIAAPIFMVYVLVMTGITIIVALSCFTAGWLGVQGVKKDFNNFMRVGWWFDPIYNKEKK